MQTPRVCRFGQLVTVVAAALSLAAKPAHAQQTFWQAILAPEVTGATGSGLATIMHDATLNTLTINATWSGLSGVTTVAHIHCCTAVAGAGFVGVAVTPGTLPDFPTGMSAGTYAMVTPLDLTATTTFTSGFLSNFGGGTAAGAEAALLAGFASGRAYFNIHTDKFMGGEIRGFITAVPEPASVALLAAGLVGLAVPAVRRRRRQRAAGA